MCIRDRDEESRKAELAEKQKALSGAKKRMEDLDRIIPVSYTHLDVYKRQLL